MPTDPPGRRLPRRLPHPRTVRTLALVVALVSCLITAALGGLTYWYVHEEVERQIDERIAVDARTLLQFERTHGFEALVQLVRAKDAYTPPAPTGHLAVVDIALDRTMGYIVADGQGVRRAGGLDADMPPSGWSEFIHFRHPDGRDAIAQGLNSRLGGGGYLLVAADRTAVDQIDAVLLRLFLAAFGILLLVNLALILGFGRAVRRRLDAMARGAEAIMAGDMSRRMPVEGTSDEFDELATVLNGMLDRIVALVTRLRELSSGLAHDLRTPLSRMQAKLERSAGMARDVEQQELLEAAIDDGNRLADLFAGLLSIAEIDGRRAQRRFVRVDLGAAAEQIAEAHRPAFEDSGHRLLIETEQAFVLGDQALLQRIAANLLDNALVHTPRGTTVTLLVRNLAEEIALSVRDDGPGVAVEDRQRIFERLVRLEPGRSGPGYGLGLSMVQAIAAAHGGTASALAPDSCGNEGLAIEVLLPSFKDQDENLKAKAFARHRGSTGCE
ncbi:ATP-binding protein [Novosphingobium sp. YAF33]|uniref:sensor histidine kinase n=1 Tax=Novosphingobium sp. YAF33 TaxID=3233082 RepID=UPI003F9B63EC